MIYQRINKFKIHLLVFILISLLFSCIQKEKQPDPLTKISYASVPAIVEAPVHIAQYKKMFEQEGLDLTLEINPDGKTSLDHLIEGKVHIAAVMATPVVYKSFTRDDFYIIGNMEHGKIHAFIARKDSKISKPTDLKGKKIAVTKGTSGEFFMISYLILNGLLPEELDIKYMNGPNMVSALVEGEIDAFFCWQPFPLMASKQLKDNFVILETPKLVPSSWIIIAMKEYVHKNPETIKKFLLAVNNGVDFVNTFPQESAKIHADTGGISLDIAEELINNMSFNLSLKHEILLDMEDEARWLISYNYIKTKEIPNYLNYIYTDAMLETFPSKVNIIKGAVSDN